MTEPSISSAPSTKYTPVIEDLLKDFVFGHLPSSFAQDVSALFHEIAHGLAGRLTHTPRLEKVLDHLLAAKDLAVRAALRMEEAAKAQQQPGGWCAPADVPLTAAPQPVQPVTVWTAPSTMTTSVAPNPSVIVSQPDPPKDAA